MTQTELTESELIAIRNEKLSVLRKAGVAYPNNFKRQNFIAPILKQHEQDDKEALETLEKRFTVAGRIVLKRVMGKASFIHIRDQSGKMQLYLTQKTLSEDLYQAFKEWDLGDIVGAEGTLFRTKTNELTLYVITIRLLTKAIRPLPDKYHGLNDQEACYRKRYLDLIANEKSRDTFIKRSKMIGLIRQYFNDLDYLEVETPMMQTIPGGAAARPFVTFHNKLKMDLYLRIAPELYLKRLVVGGFERVYEINRNFRNEGISTQHNPEFTMLEFYQAYATFEDMMSITETLLSMLTKHIINADSVDYQQQSLSLKKPFKRWAFHDAILSHNPELNKDSLQKFASVKAYAEKIDICCKDDWNLGKIQLEIFEANIEDKLIEPTFITHYPAEVSPLARVNDKDSTIADRFELFILGREIANGFSELNDPQLQEKKFNAQVKYRQSGDDEAMYFDQDYIMALEQGMPPTAGTGIGIDRLVMLLTDSASIRDVILFPTLRRAD